MTKQVQRRRGTATQHTSFTGAEGETSINTTNKSVHVHDGATAGGIEAARADLVNVSDGSLNAALTGSTVSSLTITTADINGGTIDNSVIGGTTAAAGTFTAITSTGGISIDDAIPTLRLDSPSASWSGGEDLGGVGWYTEDASGDGPAIMARIYSESSGSNSLPIPNIIFQTSLADVSLKDRMRIEGGGDISFYDGDGSTAKLFWDASAESLGIGVNDPLYPLEVQGEAGIELYSTSTSGKVLNFRPSLGDANKYNMSISAYDHSTNGFGPTDGLSINGFDGVSISTGSSTARQERMRIDSSGNVLVGTTSANGRLAVSGGSGASYSIYSTAHPSNGYNVALRGVNTTGVAVRILNSSGSDVGSIDYTASATSYTTSSDYRLKTDVQPMAGASERVLALKPVNFEWIADGTRVDGFLAHEAQAVVPEAATGTKDAMKDEEYEGTAAKYKTVIVPEVEAADAVYDDDGELVSEAVVGQVETTHEELVSETVMATRSVPDMQGIDQSKLVPLLTAALQEAITKIADLETRLEALEA